MTVNETTLRGVAVNLKLDQPQRREDAEHFQVVHSHGIDAAGTSRTHPQAEVPPSQPMSEYGTVIPNRSTQAFAMSVLMATLVSCGRRGVEKSLDTARTSAYATVLVG